MADPFKTGVNTNFSQEIAWRREPFEVDPDDTFGGTPKDVVAILGFDPADEDEPKAKEQLDLFPAEDDSAE